MEAQNEILKSRLDDLTSRLNASANLLQWLAQEGRKLKSRINKLEGQNGTAPNIRSTVRILYFTNVYFELQNAFINLIVSLIFLWMSAII